MRYLGAHVSTAGGVDQAPLRAKEIDCNTLQLFVKNNNQWLAKKPLRVQEIDGFFKNKETCGIFIAFSHAGYLINIASFHTKNYDLSMESLTQELERADILKLDFVVLHPGAHLGEGEKKAIAKIAMSLNKIFDRFKTLHPQLLLETTAGQGTSIGSRFEQLAAILEKIENKKRVGICLDTCHVFAAGYDFRTEEGYEQMWKEFDRYLGLQTLKALHLNDSKQDVGSHVDRHQHIGHGKIGEEGFRLLMRDHRFENIPMVLETPKEDDFRKSDSMNLEKLKSYATII